jgi:phospholipase D1/2
LRSLEDGDWGPCLVNGGFLEKKKNLDTDTPTENGSTQREFEWRAGPFERSIQNSYLNAIDNADRFIYIETQYLIGSGDKWGQPSVKNTVPNAIVRKIVDRIEKGRDFHCYLVIPMFPEGNPTSGAAQRQRFFEFNTMRFMAQSVFRAAQANGKDWKNFLTFYFLANWTGGVGLTEAGARGARVAANQRYQVYVHSKLMIVDDQFLILGSANLNERSLAGDRDSEICVALMPGDGKLDECRKIIGDVRRKSWARHLDGTTIPDIDSPEKPSCANVIRDTALVNWTDMAQGLRKNKSHLVHIPFEATATAFFVKVVSPTAPLKAQDPFIFDAEAKLVGGKQGNGTVIDNDWAWHAPNGTSFISDELAE